MLNTSCMRNFTERLRKQLQVNMQFKDLPILGIDQIDDEHREILLFLVQIEESSDDIEKIVNNFIDYATLHFSHEERLMFEREYPGRDKHIEEHTRIQNLINDHIVQYDPDQLEFIRTTILNHISTYDVAMARWVHDSSNGS